MFPLCAYKKRLEKKTFTKHQSVSNWKKYETTVNSQWGTIIYHKFLPKKVKERVDSLDPTSSS